MFFGKRRKIPLVVDGTFGRFGNFAAHRIQKILVCVSNFYFSILRLMLPFLYGSPTLDDACTWPTPNYRIRVVLFPDDASLRSLPLVFHAPVEIYFWHGESSDALLRREVLPRNCRIYLS